MRQSKKNRVGRLALLSRSRFNSPTAVAITLMAAIVGIFVVLRIFAAGPLNTLASANCATTATADPRTANRIYNVTSFGATGNGTTNDTVAVQTAINTARDAGGGTVWFPSGTYQVRNILVYPSITYTGNNATIQHIAGYGKDDQIFKSPRNTNYYSNPVTFGGYNGAVDSPPLVVKCLVFDGNRPADGTLYWGHQLEHAHLLYLSAETPTVGRLRAFVEDSVFMNGTADGVSIGLGVNASINRIIIKDVFRGGFVVTGDNNKVDVNSYRYVQSTGHDDSMDIEVDDPAVNNRGLNEINIYNSDLDRTLDIDMGFVYYSASYGSGTVSKVDPRTIVRLNNVNISKSPFDLNFPNSSFCALHTTTHIGKINDSNQVGRAYFGNTIEFKDSDIILSDDNPVDNTTGPIRVGLHYSVEGFGFPSQKWRFENVHFSKDASSAVPGNILDVTGRRSTDQLAFISSTIDPNIPVPVVSTDGSSTAYTSSLPSGCDWNTAPQFPNETSKLPVLNGVANTFNASFDKSYNTSNVVTPTPTPVATPNPTPSPTPGPSIAPTAPANPTSYAPTGTIDDKDAAFAYSSTGWDFYPGPADDPLLYGGGNHTTTVAPTGGIAKLAFTGGGVRLYGVADAQFGKYQVSVDGGAAQAMDAYSATRQYGAVLFEATGLATGKHILTLTALGTHNTSATGNYIAIDRADILATPATPAPTPVSTTTPTPQPTLTPAPTPACTKLGDINCDGRVNSMDLNAVLANYGKRTTLRSAGDLTGDGIVNIFDLSQILQNWGR